MQSLLMEVLFLNRPKYKVGGGANDPLIPRPWFRRPLIRGCKQCNVRRGEEDLISSRDHPLAQWNTVHSDLSNK